MKKSYVKILLVLSAFSFFSCSNGHNFETANLGDDTLKNLAKQKESDYTWTRELESVRLIRNTAKNQACAISVSLNPQCITVSKSESQGIFPFIDNFGSIDNTLITEEMAAFVTTLCSEITNWKLSTANYESEALFSLVLFKNDVEKKWAAVTTDNFPIFEDEEGNPLENVTLFDSYIIGEPFICTEEIEIPVRFYAKKAYLDVKFYITNGAQFKVNQIEIERFSKR